MTKERDRLILMDGVSTSYSAYFHGAKFGRDKEDYPAMMDCFFMRTGAIMRVYNTKDVHIFFDDTESSIRKKIYPAYREINFQNGPKAVRTRQLWPTMQKDLLECGFSLYGSPGLEGLDLIGQVVKDNPDRKISIISEHYRTLQLLSENVDVLPFTGISAGAKSLNPIQVRDFLLQYPFKISQWTDYLSMVGYGEDNIKGVKGIGKVAATDCLTGETLKVRQVAALNASKETMEKEKKLHTLPIEPVVLELQEGGFDPFGVMKVMQKLELTSRMKSPVWGGEENV